MLTKHFGNNILIRYIEIGDIIIRNYENLFVWILKHAYLCFRMAYENKFCWMDQGISVYFLAVPSILTIFINIFFLGSVVKVIRSLLFSSSQLTGAQGQNCTLRTTSTGTTRTC